MAPEGHLVHTTTRHGRDTTHRTTPAAAATTDGVDLTQGDAAVLVFRRHLLPLLDLGDPRATNGVERISHGLTGLHILQLEKGHGDQPGTTQTTDGFGDEPFRVRLGDHDDGLPGAGLQLIRSLSLEVVLHKAVDHGTGTFAHGGESGQ